MKHRPSVTAAPPPSPTCSRQFVARVAPALISLALVAAGGACAQVTQTQGGGSGGGLGTGARPGTGTGGSGSGATGGGSDASLPDQAPSEKFAGEVKTCTDVSYTFAPKIPTVFVVVDRSGSEFQSATTGTYFTLQASVLQVVQQSQDQVRFGFGDFVGDHASGACAPVFNSVPIALNNYAAIQAQYTKDGPLQPFGSKSDTPAAQVLPMVKAALAADSGDGGKYVLFVTDSETDFCDDGNALCPADAVTYRIQDMYAAGIGTLVIGLPTAMTNIATSVLQNFANAGAGQTVALPAGSGVTTPTDVGYQCAGVPSWMSLFTAAGRTPTTSIASYGSPAGTANVFMPSSASQQALTEQIAAAVNGVKSCIFDLGNVNGMAIKVDRTMLSSAHIKIMGTDIPLDDTNGWRMNTDTQLQLSGNACDLWRAPATTTIDFQFPCEIFIVG